MSESFYLARRRWMDPYSVLRLARFGPPRLVHSEVVPEWKLRALRERRPHPWIIWLAFARTEGVNMPAFKYSARKVPE